jgi:tetratricopeptide (TPR) repeat protein
MNQTGNILSRCFELAGAGRLDEAGDLAEQALAVEEENGSLWRFVGLMRHQAGDFVGACEALETAQLLVPLDPAAYCALAECLARTGCRGLAGEIYRGLATREGTPERLLPTVAAGLGYLGEYSSALDVCVDLTRRRPESPEAHFGVAFYLRRLGKPPSAALPHIARAHELAPDVALYRISLATLLDHAGRREEAYDLLRDVDLDSVSCRCCLRRMTTIFLAVGDASRGETCRRKAAEGQDDCC